MKIDAMVDKIENIKTRDSKGTSEKYSYTLTADGVNIRITSEDDIDELIRGEQPSGLAWNRRNSTQDELRQDTRSG